MFVKGKTITDHTCGGALVAQLSGSTVVGSENAGEQLIVDTSAGNLGFSVSPDMGADGAVCNMALMDIDDLDAAMATAARVLNPGGWFSFSLLHPCFPGLRNGASEQLSSWPPDRGYAAEGWWTTHGDGVRGRVGANHRMISTYLNATLRAGFEFEEFGEPAAQVPRFFIARCRRET